LAALVLLYPFAIRTMLILDRQVETEFIDTLGFLSDLSAGLLACFSIIVMLNHSRILAGIGGTLWLAINITAYEYIAFFDSPYALAQASFLVDRTFLAGSAMGMGYPLLHMTTWCALIWLIFSSKTPEKILSRYLLAAFVTVTVANLAVMPVPNRQEWRQRNFLYANIFPDYSGMVGTAIALEIPTNISQRFIDRPRSLLAADLSGRSWLADETRRHNVLLVILEGVSGGHIPRIATHHGINPEERLVNLDSLANSGIFSSFFVAQQRQTNRGLYALLCGNYPKLLMGEPRMTEYVGLKTRTCLPEALRYRGYETVYIQAAPLPFMMKDRFMPKAGFAEVHGAEYFDKGYARSEWGVDDKAFFEQSLSLLRGLRERNSPWFVTLLTSGTHHPFTLPDSFRPEQAQNDRQRSLLWMDEAVGSFVRKLDEMGFLHDTLVIITSDESSGITAAVDATAHRLAQNWGFLIALTPDKERQHLTQPILQSDLSLSVLDYLGQAEGSHDRWAGRSLWRTYPDDRPITFANIYFREVSMVIGKNKFLTCKETNLNCSLASIAPNGRDTRVQSVSPGSEAVKLLQSIARESAKPGTRTTLIKAAPSPVTKTANLPGISPAPASALCVRPDS